MTNSKIQNIKKVFPRRAVRRLAAILFTDIVGYTALMQEDEQQAIAKLTLFKKTLTHRAPQYKGEIIQYYGDGCLLIFASSFEAVDFAKCIQQDFRKDPSLPVRIGIHAGDVVMKDGLIFGDNVNLASRIESLGVPGSILFSETVRNQIKNQASLQISPLGPFHFKNVKEPMELFALSNEGFPLPVPEEMEGKLKTNPPKDLVSEPEKKLGARLGSLSILLVLITGVWYFFFRPSEDAIAAQQWKNSIAILPFHNLNHDPEKEFLSIGIADEIRAQLASIPSLKVISRSSSMCYYKKDYPIQKIGEELKASYILEGTVQQQGDDLKISVQLSNASTDQVEWAPVYARHMEDLFTIQKEIALEVVNKLQLDLSKKEKEELNKEYSLSSSTYALYLKAINSISLMSEDGIRTGEKLLGDVIDLAEDFPQAYTGMALITIFKSKENGAINQDSARRVADFYVEQAKKIDPDLPQIHSVQAMIHFYFDWNIEAAEKEARKAVETGDPQGYLLLTDILIRTMRYDEALQQLDYAIELDPINVTLMMRYGQIHFARNETEKAFEVFIKVMQIDSLFGPAIEGLAMIHIKAKRYSEAIKLLDSQTYSSGKPSGMSRSLLAIANYHSGANEKTTRILDEMQALWRSKTQAGMAYSIGRAYAGMGMSSKALEWLHRSSKAHESEMMDLLMEPLFQSLQEEEGFIILLKDTGLAKYKGNF